MNYYTCPISEIVDEINSTQESLNEELASENCHFDTVSSIREDLEFLRGVLKEREAEQPNESNNESILNEIGK
jgi:hypothetical protein